ncbi:tetratricopeptide repeat protein [Persicirhabdus sediminis]|uniref:Tetratricopeptide repeat protein n=1 Tax=Persicirhabdus sediminis TaxID=454144 RepID=A0A8J7MEF6_9BACT|nr:tetratricopeptide repeat protein [Persicirhabdus sediminis]MBK1791197.1 tetratricopeptide repeat protein [Persicirhabdus sediminis]
MDKESFDKLAAFQTKAESLRKRGETEELVSFVEKRVNEVVENDESGVSFYQELLGDIHRELGNASDAVKAYLGSLSSMQPKGMGEDYLSRYARINTAVAVLYEEDGQLRVAADYYGLALEAHEAGGESQTVKALGICNNVAFIRKTLEEYDAAETYYLKALEICHAVFGPEHENTLVVYNNTATLYSVAGHLEQAKELCLTALKGVEKTESVNTLDTAQIHLSLAHICEALGDHIGCRRHYENSIRIYGNRIKDASDHYVEVADQYAKYLRSIGEEMEAFSVTQTANLRLRSA